MKKTQKTVEQKLQEDLQQGRVTTKLQWNTNKIKRYANFVIQQHLNIKLFTQYMDVINMKGIYNVSKELIGDRWITENQVYMQLCIYGYLKEIGKEYTGNENYLVLIDAMEFVEDNINKFKGQA